MGTKSIVDIRAGVLEEAADEIVRLKKIGSTPYADCTPSEREDYSHYVHASQEAWLRARAVSERGGK